MRVFDWCDLVWLDVRLVACVFCMIISLMIWILLFDCWRLLKLIVCGLFVLLLCLVDLSRLVCLDVIVCLLFVNLLLV